MTDQETTNPPETETKIYADGTVATGPGPLPDLSPAEQEVAASPNAATPAEEPAQTPLTDTPASTPLETNSAGTANDAALSGIIAPKSDKISLIEDLENGMRHFIERIEELFGAHHPEVNTLKSVVNNDLQSLKKKA